MKRKITAKKKSPKKKHTQTYWEQLLGKPKRKATPKPKAARRRVKAMPKKKEKEEEHAPDQQSAATEEVKTTPLEGASGNEVENPPPAPPKVKSEPTEVPEPLEVRDPEVPISADPEDPNAVFELDLLHHASIRGTGPRPEEVGPGPQEETENKEEKAKQLKADEAAEQEFLTKEAKK